MLEVDGFKILPCMFSLLEMWAECRPRQRLCLESQLPAVAGSAGPADQSGGPAAASTLEVDRTFDSPNT